MADKMVYRVKFTPIGPYFFGNEQDLTKSYFIKSEKTPLVSTVLGALRYLMLPHKKQDFNYTSEELAENYAVSGAESFRIDAKSVQSFGRICNISPVFLTDGTNDYVRTPFDHSNGEKYTPFSDFRDIITAEGTKKYTEEFDAKAGFSESFMCLADGSLVLDDDIFKTETRVGIAKTKLENSFFKKELIKLNEGWSFAVYVETVDGNPPFEGPGIAMMGLGRNAFVTEVSNPVSDCLADQISALLPEGRVYFLGDTLVSTDIYRYCQWSAMGLRQYRSFTSRKMETGTTLHRGDTLYRMICAGSVVLCEDSEALAKCVENENLQQVGFNQIVLGRKQG